MTQKFHIDKNGKPAPCRATKRPCPLGGAEVHFDSYEEAYQAAQEQLKDDYTIMGVSDYYTSKLTRKEADTIAAMAYDAKGFILSLDETKTEELQILNKVRPDINFLDLKETVHKLDNMSGEVEYAIALADEYDQWRLIPMLNNPRKFIRDLNFERDEEVGRMLSEYMPELDIEKTKEHIEIMEYIEDEFHNELNLVD